MNTMRKILCFVLSMVLCLALLPAASAEDDIFVAGETESVNDRADDTTWYGGWKQVDGKWYFIDGSGNKAKGLCKDDKGVTYYFDNNGVMQTGWQKIGGGWYYFSSSGAMKTGWVKSSGKWYYLGESGAMLTRTVIHTEGGIYAVGDDGAMLTNTTVQTTDGSHYHFGADGKCDNRY